MRVRKPWDLPPGSQGCAGVGRIYAKKQARRGQGGRLLLACVTPVSYTHLTLPTN